MRAARADPQKPRMAVRHGDRTLAVMGGQGNSRTRAGRTTVRRALAGAAAGVVLVALWAHPARATLAYTRDWDATQASVWAAADDGSGPHRLAYGQAPHVSPDGRLVEYRTVVSHDRVRLWVVPAAGGTPRVVARSAEFLAWSPDSRQIAVATVRTMQRLVLVDVASTATRTLFVSTLRFASASFSPAGDALVYASARDELALELHRDDLFVASVRGGRPRRLTSGARSAAPLWGPHWIAFQHERPRRRRSDPTRYDLYLVRPDGTGLHRLTRVTTGRETFGFAPVAWSANGRRLVANLDGEPDFYVAAIDPTTGAVHAVGRTTDPARRGAGIWGTGISRDGTTILGTTASTTWDGDVVTIPWHGGPPTLLTRQAIDPSWSR